MRLDDFRSLEESGKEGDSLFKSKIMQKTNRKSVPPVLIIGIIYYLCTRNPKGKQRHIAQWSLNHHTRKRRAIQLKLGLPHYGRRLPISVVVCGEPRDLWRMSAPLILKLINNTNMNKIVIGLLLCVSIPMWGEDTKVKVGDLYYTLNGAYASVAMNCIDINSSYTNDCYTVPSEISYQGQTYIVNALGMYAFSSNWGYVGRMASTASKIKIPNTIIRIGQMAFYDCKELISFVVPESVQEFEKSSPDKWSIFDGCDKLRTIIYLPLKAPNKWTASSNTYVPDIVSYSNPAFSINNATVKEIITFSPKTFVYNGKVPEVNWTNNVEGYEAQVDLSGLKKDVGNYVDTIPVKLTKDGETIDARVIYRYSITGIPLTVIVNNANRLYGTENPKFTYSIEGFINGDTESVLLEKPSISTNATIKSNAGTYSIEASGGKAAYYTFNYVPGVLTIEKAPLKASVGNYERPYNENNPNFEIKYEGFVLSENYSVLDTKPTATTSATRTSDVGVYDITVSGGSDNNYDISYSSGLLTIKKADQTLSWEQNLSNLKVYDQVELKASATSGLPISYTMDETDVCEIYKAGSKTYISCDKPGTVRIKAIQEGNGNYETTARMYKEVKVSNPDDDKPTLSIKQINSGTISKKIEKGEIYSFKITPETGWHIHSVTFNGADYTSQLDASNTFKTPRINADATITIAYAEGSSGVSNARANTLKVLGISNGINIIGTNIGEQVLVYGTDGLLVHSEQSSGKDIQVTLSPNNIYIVKVGNQTIKIGL